MISGLQCSFHPNFRAKHVTFVTDSHDITYDFLLKDIESAGRSSGSGKQTYIVVLKRNDNEVKSFYQELESLVSSKITKGACRKKRTNMPRTRGICKQQTYWFCSIQMNELTTKSYLAEFYFGNKRSCKFSEHGTFELGAEMVTSNSIYVDHLEKSSLDLNNRRFCF